MIDGYTSVQAIRHKQEHGQSENIPTQTRVPVAAPQDAVPESGGDAAKKAAVGRTALPTRHDITCYSCGYSFVVTGRLDKVFCPKCREQLETGDYDIEGEWTQDVLTVGKVYIHSGAVVKGAAITANDIIIAGDCCEANLQPVRHIELESGAVVPTAVLADRKVIIRSGASLSFATVLHCTELEIRCELSASAQPSGLVTIFAGGFFRGSLECRHLVVHDGAGISAELKILPERSRSEADGGQDGPPAADDRSAGPDAVPAAVAQSDHKQAAAVPRYKPPAGSGGSRIPITLK